MQNSETPKLVAIVLADQIFQDKGSGKHIISGTFSNFRAPSFPIRLANCGVYICLDGALENMKITLLLKNRASAKERLIATWEILEVPKADGEIVELFAQLNGLVFDSSGFFDFVVKHADAVLGSRSIKVINLKG